MLGSPLIRCPHLVLLATNKRFSLYFYHMSLHGGDFFPPSKSLETILNALGCIGDRQYLFNSARQARFGLEDSWIRIQGSPRFGLTVDLMATMVKTFREIAVIPRRRPVLREE